MRRRLWAVCAASVLVGVTGVASAARASATPTSTPNASTGFQLYLPVPWQATINASGPHLHCGYRCSSGSTVLNSVDLGYAGDQTGTMNVLAAADGVVAFHGDYAYTNNVRGAFFNNCWASIDHANGWRTTYYHLTNADLSLNGKAVHAGQRIATDGFPVKNTCGSGDVAHVHFSLWRNPPTVGSATNGTPIAIDSTSIGGYTVHAGTGSCKDYPDHSYYGSWTRDGNPPVQVIAPGCFERPSLLNNILRPLGTAVLNNLLQSASFEGGNATGWQLNAGANLATYSDGTAHEGQYFLQMNTGSLGGGGVASLFQDVSLQTAAGQSFSFSAWLRSASGAPAGVCVVLWGFGGTQEGGGSQQTCTTLSSTAWRLVAVPLDTTTSNHSSIRAQIYMETAGVNYDVDGAQLVNTGLSSASFEGATTTGWQVNPGANAVPYSNATAHDGQSFLEMNTGSLGGGGVASLWQDVPLQTSVGQSFSFAVWLRSPSGNAAGVCVVLWGLGGTQEGGGSQQTCTTLSSTAWRLVTVPLDTHASSHSTLRAQVYMETAGVNYDVDGAQLVNTGLLSASFEGGNAPGWQLTTGANAAIYNTSSRDGQSFLEMNTGSLGSGGVASLWQDIALATTAGQSYSFSVWLRSPSGGAAGVCVVLWGLGGTQEGGGAQQTCTTLSGTAWQLLTVPLDTHASSHSTLRAQVYMESAGINYDVDGATLKVGGARTTVAADLSAAINSPSTATKGQHVTFTLTSTNHGPDPAAGTTGVLLLPLDASVITKPAGCTTGTTTVGAQHTQMRYVSCALTTPLGSGQSDSFQAVESYANSGTHRAFAYTHSSTSDPVADNNTASETTNVS